MNLQENHIVYSFPRGGGEEIQMSLKKHNDQYYIDLRHWFQAKNENQFLPTKRGVYFSIDSLPDLRRGVERLSKAVARIHQLNEATKI